MSDDSLFIPGIYNYCDRWCCRCAFTARCRLFADEKRLMAEVEDGVSDEAEDEFWEMLDLVAENGSDSEIDGEPEFDSELDYKPESELDVELELEPADAEAALRRDEEVNETPLVKLSAEYADAADEWLKSHEADFAAERGLIRDGKISAGPADALEVISWYQYQISIKLSRAERGKLESQEEAAEAGESWDTGSGWTEDEPDDSQILSEVRSEDADGSAKVALLGIERSLGAWTILRETYPAEEAQIKALQQQLARLRRMLDTTYPGARTFHRPGLDD